MTDRVHSLTVVLEQDVREDDVQSLTKAIHMMRGVLSVTNEVADLNSHMAEERAKFALGQQLLKVVYPDLGK
jgi:hypothetical protein